MNEYIYEITTEDEYLDYIRRHKRKNKGEEEQ